jgi:hypothetical protein
MTDIEMSHTVAGMTVGVGEQAACGGCGEPTVLRVAGLPWHPGDMAGRCPTLPPDLASGEDLRLLTALEKQFPPLRTIGGRPRAPFWRPSTPGVLNALQHTPGWAWQREYTGPVIVLDRSGAWIAAASSADVAWGALECTGPMEEYDKGAGFYEVGNYPWHETLPHPLGRYRAGQETAWVTGPRVGLLADLAAEGRWPDATIRNSYTGLKVRLTRWATYVNGLRTAAIQQHGRDSEEYDRIKIAFSQAITLMLGTHDPGRGRVWKCGCQRPDWGYTIQDQAAVTVWRWADRCYKASGEYPVALRNVDELLIPADTYEQVTTVRVPGAATPLQIDDTGCKLGTFKIKYREEW